MPGVSNEAMELIYRIIYGKRTSPERNLSLETLPHRLWNQLYVAARKYDLSVVSAVLWTMPLNFKVHWSRFPDMLSTATSFRDKELEEHLFDCIGRVADELPYHSLSSLSFETIKKLLQQKANEMFEDIVSDSKFDYRKGQSHMSPSAVSPFISMVIRFMKESPNMKLWRFLNDLYPEEYCLALTDDLKCMVKFLALKHSMLMMNVLLPQNTVIGNFQGVRTPRLHNILDPESRDD